MTTMQRHVVQDDFSEGMVRDVAPSLISESGCYDLVDALLDEDGNPYLRGGTEYHSKEGLGTSGLTWITDVYLAPGRRTVFANNSDFGVLGSDDESVVNLGGAGLTTPKQSAVLKDLLYIGGGSIYAGSRKSAVYSTGKAHVTKGSKTVEGESSTAWAANVDPGMLFQIGAERVYIVDEVLSDTKLILRDAYEGTSGTLKSYSLSPVYTVGADPYEVSDYVTVCENRLVMLIGHKVIFTEVNNPHSITNQFSTTNEHTLPEGVEGIGLTTAGQTVIIFTTAGVWALDGLALDIVDSVGNPQHRLQRISPEVVLAGASGLAGSEQRIVVPAADGIYLMDGISQPVRISRPIDRLYQRRIIAGYRLGRAVVYRGHYFLPLVDGEGNVRDLFVCRLDRPTHSRRQGGFPWSRLTGDGGEMAAFAVRAETTAAEPVLLGAQAREPSRVIDCSTYFEPGAEHETDADESLIGFDLVTRDIPTGNEIANVVRSLWLRYELVNGGGNPIVKVYWSDGSLEGGEAEWDEVSWDEFNWAEDETGVTFQGVLRDGPPSDGREHEKFRVNQRMGFGRFRVRTFGRTPFFSLRLLQVNLRPSGAVR